MDLVVDRKSPVSTSYKAERARGLFNVEEADGAGFQMQATLPIESKGWQIGVVVGSSGSGKSSIGATIEEGSLFTAYKPKWSKSDPVIDAVGLRDSSFDQVTAVLSSVGLGSVPAWLRPYGVLSNGEKFRADCAATLIKAPKYVVIDEFTSVLDRQVARVGAAAFVKAWRKKEGHQLILLTCHHDVLDWLEPDWVFDTDKQRLFVGLEAAILENVEKYPEVAKLVIRR